MQEYVGTGGFDELLKALEAAGKERLFLVTGRSSYEHSAAKHTVDGFCATRTAVRFYEFDVNPKENDALLGAKVFREFAPDCVLAIGGGSVIDMAKLVIAAAHNKDDLRGLLAGERELLRGDVPLYVAPTTSGSGSESTQFAIIYVDGVKFSLSHPALRPDAVAVDPVLSASMSPYLTACTGFDALAQAIESYWSCRANQESMRYSLQAIESILPSIVAAVNSPTPEVRTAMVVGSCTAGKAINITTTTIAHALSYHLTTHYDVPHGHAVALTLGRFFRGNGDGFVGREGTEKATEVCLPAGAEWEVDGANGSKAGVTSGSKPAPNAMGRLQDCLSPAEYGERMQCLYNVLGCSNPAEAEGLWYGLMEQCGLPTKLSDVGMDNVHDMVMAANMQRLGNNPVVFTHDELKELLTPLCG